MKTKLAFLALLCASPFAHAAGAVDGGGISKLYLSCNSPEDASVSYNVQVVSGFFLVDGSKTWTMGVDVRALNKLSNREELIKSTAVQSNKSLTDIEGDGLDLKQVGPSNFNMKEFRALLHTKLDNGSEITAVLNCQIPN
jgi:hypothetical protein